MIEDYTGRKFGVGSFTERGETVVDQRGRIVITTRSVPVNSVDTVKVWVP